MTPEAIITISATVVALTQFAKWAGVPNKWGPGVVMLLALVGLLFWAVSQPNYVTRLDLWSYFAAWALIATSAAGIFGFVKAGDQSSAVTTMRGGSGSGMG